MKQLSIQRLQCLHIGPVDLEVGAKQCVSFSGPSGSGKSILLKAIIDLIPNQGHISLNGDSREKMKASDWRRQVGLLPAESYWWEKSVGEHFPTLSEQQQSWFTMLGFEQAVLDWELSRCSTGERQRLALLRLLCNEPEVLLLDEPTANLDRTSTENVEKVIQQYREQSHCPIIWVSHDQQQIKRVADQHYELDSQGKFSQVML